MPTTNPAKPRAIHAPPPRYTFHILKTRRSQKISLGLAALESHQDHKAAPPLHSGATLRSLRRSPATGIGAPRAGAPDSLSAARRATGDFGRPLVPPRPKTSMTRASAPRASFLRVCRVDALAPRISRQYFDKPTCARAPHVARAQRLVRPRARLKQANRAGSCRCVSLRAGPGAHSPASTISALAHAQASGF